MADTLTQKSPALRPANRSSEELANLALHPTAALNCGAAAGERSR